MGREDDEDVTGKRQGEDEGKVRAAEEPGMWRGRGVHGTKSRLGGEGKDETVRDGEEERRR